MARALVLSPKLSMTSGEGPMNARPASSTLRANSAFSAKKPYLYECSIRFFVIFDAKQRTGIPGVDHVNAVFEGNVDNVVLGKICTNGGEAFANLISFVGLQRFFQDKGQADRCRCDRTF